MLFVHSQVNLSHAFNFGVPAEVTKEIADSHATNEKSKQTEKVALIASANDVTGKSRCKLKCIDTFINMSSSKNTADKGRTELQCLDNCKETALDNWYWRPSVVIPVFKIYGSKTSNTLVDVTLNGGIGGGLSIVKYTDTTGTNPLKTVIVNGESVTGQDTQPEISFSFSPCTVLMSKESNDSTIAISYAMTVGFFNNTIVMGIGYDFGQVVDRSRLFGLLSIGASF